MTRPRDRGTAETSEAHITAHMGGRSQKQTGSGLESHLAESMRLTGLPEPEREYRFHPTRKWRLDFAWPALMWAVEVEGGIYRGGGHTHVKDLKRDMEKQNALMLLGWRVLRFHGDQVRSGEAAAVIAEALGAGAREATETIRQALDAQGE